MIEGIVYVGNIEADFFLPLTQELMKLFEEFPKVEFETYAVICCALRSHRTVPTLSLHWLNE